MAYTFGAFSLAVDARKLWREGGNEIQLPSRAFDALVYLIEHRDRLVRKNELVEAVWHDVVVTDDSLIHAISVIRRALGDDPNEPHYVQTIPRRGYRFVAQVDPVADAGAVEPARGPEPALSSKALADPASPPVAPAAFMMPSPRWHRSRASRAGVAILLAAIGVAGTVIWLSTRVRNAETHDAARAIRLSQPAPDGASIVAGGVLSPDGQQLTFVARDNASGRNALWLRTLYSSELKALDNTDAASKPFWSADSSRIGFFANGKLLAVNVSDGAVRVVAEVGITPAGGTWAPDDTILFADWAKGLYTVRSSGGEPHPVATLDRPLDIAFSWPQFLPDGRHFLYQIVSLGANRTGTYIGDLDSQKSVRLLDTESPAVFAPPRHLLHIRRDMLIADEFDARSLQLTGRTTVLARGVSQPPTADENEISAAADLIAYRKGTRQQQLVWVDRTGEVLSTVQMPAEIFNPRVSPDGSRLLATSSLTTNPGLWLTNLTRAEFERLDTDAIAPLWSPDGERVAYTTRGGFDFVVRSTTEQGSRPLVTGSAIKILNDWAPDGTHIVFTQMGERTKLDLWGIRLEDGALFPILATPSNEMQARMSPDGKWIAYVSDESGTMEVYAQRYPELGERYKLSVGGGGQPQWRHDQREIFYMAPDHAIAAVSVDTSQEAIFGTPKRLFRAPITAKPDNARDNYVAASDGSRFLVDGVSANVTDSTITLVVKWPAETAIAAAQHFE